MTKKNDINKNMEFKITNFETFQKEAQLNKKNRIKDMLGGKWKIIILFRINIGINRFLLIEKSLNNISKNVLTKNLRELENDNLINRINDPKGSSKVFYELTDIAHKLIPIYKNLTIWFFENFDQKNIKYLIKN